MTKSKWYLILLILDVILIIMWPIALTMGMYPNWLAFMVGAVWCCDIFDLKRHYLNYKEAKFYEEFEEV